MHVLVNCFEIQDRFSPHLKLTMHCIEALDKASINPGTKQYTNMAIKEKKLKGHFCHTSVSQFFPQS